MTRSGLRKGLGLLAGTFFAAMIAQAGNAFENQNLRWGHFAPAEWGAAQAEQLMTEEIERLTDGAVKIRIFWSGAIGGFGELMELTQSGAVDIGSFVPTYHPSQWPMMGPINSLPLVWNDPVLAMELQAHLIENNAAIQAELENNGVMPIALHGLPPYRLQCTSPVRTIADLEGKRIRTFGEWPPYIFEELGAIPVNIPLGEVYEALQRGSIDCGYNPNENAGFLRLYEVAKYWSDINLGAIAGFTAFTSRENWEAKSDELRAAFVEARATAEAFEKGNFAKLEEKFLGIAKQNGVEYIAFEEQEELNARFPDMIQVWEDRMCETAALCDDARSVAADMRAFTAARQ